MIVFPRQSFNPNPISKFIVVFILGLTVVHPLHDVCTWGIVLFIAICFLLNGHWQACIKGMVFFLILFPLPSFDILYEFPFYLKMLISVLVMIRMFYLPFLAGTFLMETSDVGSMISSMDTLRVPKAISIPIAVMFRFFPSFNEERKNIKCAMKIRGISFKNPIAYVSYVTVPLLIVSSNMADDIAKAAEVKCIEKPGHKIRYIQVGIGWMDFVYVGVVLFAAIGGWLCLK